MLGRRVSAAAVVDLKGGDRGHRHDQPVAGGDQTRQQGAGDAQGTQHVGFPHPAPVVQIGLGDWLQTLGSAGIVDQDVHPGKPRGQSLDRRVVSDIGHDGRAADLLGKPPDPVGAAGHGDDMKALCGKRSRCRLTDSGTCSGDHGHP